MIELTTVTWNSIHVALNEKGYCKVPQALSLPVCNHLKEVYEQPDLYRSTINMERYRFGKGEYKYYSYPLPEIIKALRETLYNALTNVANEWMEKLSVNQFFPEQHVQLIEQCHTHNQARPTPLILRYEKGGHNTLHQDLYGEIFFPLQVVFALSEPGVDYEGGEFVLTTQLPRAQSQAKVVTLHKGDALIFTTNFRPVKGARGYYKATVKHGVSEITSGTRYSLGIIFHDAH